MANANRRCSVAALTMVSVDNVGGEASPERGGV